MISEEQLREIVEVFDANEIMDYITINAYDFLFYVIDLAIENTKENPVISYKELDRILNMLGGILWT